MANDVEEFMWDKRLERPTLIGHSMYAVTNLADTGSDTDSLEGARKQR